MRTVTFATIIVSAVGILTIGYQRTASQAVSPVPSAHFHHVGLNSSNPAAAIDYYIKAFPTSTKVNIGGQDGLKTANVAVLFNKVNTPPPNDPPTAIWHFGWLVPDSRARMEMFDQMGLKVEQMYATPDGPMIKITSDTYPGNLTVEQLAQAKANGVQPSHVGGYEYLRGPDNVMFENNGNSPERVDHLHMFAENPVCAQIWYTQHLGGNAQAARGRAGEPPPAPPTMETCKTPYGPPTFPSPVKNGWLRSPTAVVRFDDVAFYIIPKQISGPLAPTKGQGTDHMGLSVSDLDATVARLKREGVKFLEQTHSWGNTRAAMIEGPDSVSIELVEVK